MKEKKHISPIDLLGTLLLISGMSVFNFVEMLTSRGEETNPFSWLMLLIALVFMTCSTVFTIKIWVNKKSRKGDEFSTKMIHKAAYYSFLTVIALLSLIFVISYVYLRVNEANATIDNYLSIRSLLSIVAGISIAGTTLFSLLLFILLKKGASE